MYSLREQTKAAFAYFNVFDLKGIGSKNFIADLKKYEKYDIAGLSKQ